MPDPNEQAAIALMVTWREQENLSWPAIALRLLRQKFRTKDGREWSPQRCRRAYLAVASSCSARSVPC